MSMGWPEFYERGVNKGTGWVDFCTLLRYIFLVGTYTDSEQGGVSLLFVEPLQMPSSHHVIDCICDFLHRKIFILLIFRSN